MNLRTMGIDPGDTVGFSIGVGEELQSSGAAGTSEFLYALRDELDDGFWDWVAVERFDLRVSSPEAVRTIEYIGAIKWICLTSMVPVIMVEASHKVKTLEEVSKTVGSKHARDAEAVRLWALRYGRK